MDTYKALDAMRSVPTGRIYIADIDDRPDMLNWISSKAWIVHWMVAAVLAGAVVATVIYAIRIGRRHSRTTQCRPGAGYRSGPTAASHR